MPEHEQYKNRLKNKDRAIHGWYRFVLAYPPHLVREYLGKLDADPERDWIFDPFSGTATTPLEARLNGYRTIGNDANPIAALANKVKLNWDIHLRPIEDATIQIAEQADRHLASINVAQLAPTFTQLPLFDSVLTPTTSIIDTDPIAIEHKFEPDDYLTPDVRKVLPKGFISEKPLKRVLAIRHAIEALVVDKAIRDFLLLALANTILSDASNVAFGPEIYATKAKDDAQVVAKFYATVMQMMWDMEEVHTTQTRPFPDYHTTQDDARLLKSLATLPKIGMVITSPPYPNEKDYTRTTRLENVLLGFINSRKDLRHLKENLLRSNTRNVFATDDDDRYIRDLPSIVHLANQIEQKRLELGKTSGFEKLYHRVVLLYFGGMYRHLVNLYPRLRPGARCAYVVGDQMSFFRIHIPTAQLLADVALKAGYQVEGIEIWRTRFSTTTKRHIEENVLILKRPE